MKFEDLTEDLKDKIEGLKHGAATIEADVMAALEEAENIEDFREGVRSKMKILAEECKDISNTFYDVTPEPPIRVVVNMFGGCIESVSSDRPVDVIFVDPETEMIDEEAIQKINGDDFYVSHHVEVAPDLDHVNSIFKQVLANEEKKG